LDFSVRILPRRPGGAKEVKRKIDGFDLERKSAQADFPTFTIRRRIIR